MPANEVLSVRNGSALIVTFNRPDHKNALTMDMASQTFTILKNATTDRSVRAVMLNGAGRNFMCGLDMGLFKGDMGRALEQANMLVGPYHNIIRELQAMDKPVLACVEGDVTAQGLSIMLACDLVIASRSAKFAATFTDKGLSPDGACSYFLTRKAGMGRAIELMISCRAFDSAEAQALGLVNRVVDDDKITPESMDWLSQLAEGPTKSYGAVKKLALRAFEQDLHGQLGLEHSFLGAAMRGFDFRDYLRAQASNGTVKFLGN